MYSSHNVTETNAHKAAHSSFAWQKLAAAWQLPVHSSGGQFCHMHYSLWATTNLFVYVTSD